MKQFSIRKSQQKIKNGSEDRTEGFMSNTKQSLNVLSSNFFLRKVFKKTKLATVRRRGTTPIWSNDVDSKKYIFFNAMQIIKSIKVKMSHT